MTGLHLEEERINFTPIILYIYHIHILQNEYMRKKYDNLTPRDITYLIYIFYNQNCSQRDLSELMFVSESGVAQTIQKLEKNGYIERTVDETKKTRKIINLTNEGKLIIFSLIKSIYEMESRLFADIDDDEVRDFKRMLYRYAQETVSMTEKLDGADDKNIGVPENMNPENF
ncbi:MarR family winged helix-turn-helix transcriptional regulator [Methanobrevibacter sp.]|uniref:MarR family winged helix-turn-helix transcriptional regulator n=1 Tax=Methanobrevibacter sp. TaxID=66852 RepID=UPI00388EC98B